MQLVTLYFPISLVELQIKVQCQFYDDIGVTIVKHYHSFEPTVTAEPFTLEGCYDPGCFKDNITYDATAEQIEAIIYLSKDCSQTVVHKCSGRISDDHYTIEFNPRFG